MPHSKKMSKGTALITGGAVRLGKVFSETLADAGYKLAIHYNTSSEQAAITAEEIKKKGVDVQTFQFDFSQKNDVSILIKNVREQFPDLNVLINSASAYDQANMMETSELILERQFKINFLTPYLLTQAFVQQCKSGDVINIIDNKIAFNQYQYSAYVLSKKSLAEFTRLSAVELAPDIRVNGIAPGVILPASVRSQEYIDWRVNGIPLKQQGQTKNITQALQYFLTNKFVCGQILYVDGGESLTNDGQNFAKHDGHPKI